AGSPTRLPRAVLTGAAGSVGTVVLLPDALPLLADLGTLRGVAVGVRGGLLRLRPAPITIGAGDGLIPAAAPRCERAWSRPPAASASAGPCPRRWRPAGKPQRVLRVTCGRSTPVPPAWRRRRHLPGCPVHCARRVTRWPYPSPRWKRSARPAPSPRSAPGPGFQWGLQTRRRRRRGSSRAGRCGGRGCRRNARVVAGPVAPLLHAAVVRPGLRRQ